MGVKSATSAATYALSTVTIISITANMMHFIKKVRLSFLAHYLTVTLLSEVLGC